MLLVEKNKSDLSIKASSFVKKSLKISDLIQINAERKRYGVKNFSDFALPSEQMLSNKDHLQYMKANKELIDTDGALELWEITSSFTYLSSDRAKAINSFVKSTKNKILNKCRIYEKLIALIDKAKKEKDICKLQDEAKKLESLLERERELEKKEKEK